jgi:predicted site-specific integrase-resolvase
MDMKVMVEKLGMDAKAIRRAIRAGKIKATKDENGRWTVNGELPSKEELTKKVAKVKKEKIEEKTEETEAK